MAEQFLHRAQIRTILQEVAGKGVTQDMRRYHGGGQTRANGDVLEVAGEDLAG